MVSIGLIGCGIVGVTISYFVNRKHRISGVFDINKVRQKRAQKILGIKNNPCFIDLVKNSSVLFIATPDDKIALVGKNLKQHIEKPVVIFHFSGLLPAEIIPRTSKISSASAHPFATFPTLIIPPHQKRFHLFIQGEKKTWQTARRIFPQKYFKIDEISKHEKLLYHLLGIFSSNFLVALSKASHEIVNRLGWNRRILNEIVYPIMQQTLHNIKKNGLKKALSGPIKRGDIETIKLHIATLKKYPNLLSIYKALSRAIVPYTQQKSRRPTINRLLSDYVIPGPKKSG